MSDPVAISDRDAIGWLALTSGDIVRNTSLTFADVAELTDEQILLLAASAKREHRAMEQGQGNNPSSHRGPLPAEGFRDEGELKANYLQLGRMLGLSPEQSELEFVACKERGAEFMPKRK